MPFWFLESECGESEHGRQAVVVAAKRYNVG